MIGIRSDANMTIATGHVMRCITIANELNKLGEEIVFFTADHESDSLLSDYPFHHVVLGSKWSDMESELPVLIESLQVRNIKTLIVDSYQVTYDYFKALSRVCKLVYIDDLNESTYPVNMLINYNGYAEDLDYETDYKNRSTRLLLGLKYAPLRPQFYAESDEKGTVADISSEENYCESESFNNKFNLLLSSGGGDKLHCMVKILDELSRQDYFTLCNIHVVVGSFVDSDNELERLSNRYQNIVLHRSVNNMASLMRKCDIALTAAGTVLTECAATSLPALFFLTADNQRYEITYWKKNGLCIYCGDMAENMPGAITNIKNNLSELINNSEKLSYMQNGLKDITDGMGAVRIAEEILKL